MAQSAFLEHAPAAALAGLAVGGGARLIKNLFDIARRGAQDEVSKLSITEQPVAEVPMEVSEEEADELRRSGVRIQRLKQVQPSEKLAGDFSTSPASSQIGRDKIRQALLPESFTVGATTYTRPPKWR